jgi:hypothetical protein
MNVLAASGGNLARVHDKDVWDTGTHGDKGYALSVGRPCGRIVFFVAAGDLFHTASVACVIRGQDMDLHGPVTVGDEHDPRASGDHDAS